MDEENYNLKSSTDSKSRIIEAAMAEFAEYGLAGARVDRIAKESGVNKAMIYYHFKSKENMYYELIRLQMDKFTSRVVEQLDHKYDFESILRAVISAHHIFFSNASWFLRPIFLREMASGGSTFVDVFKQSLSKKGLLGKLKASFEQGKAEGKYRDLDTAHTVISLMGMNLFYLLFSPILNDLWDIDDEDKFRRERLDIIIDIFLHGIEAKK